MRTPFFYTLLLFTPLYTWAQDFVVSSKGDTIQGNVKILLPGNTIVVTTPEKKKKSYSIIEVQRATIDGEYFRPVKNGEKYMFMKRLTDGYLSLYAFQPENQFAYDGRYLLKRDGQGIEVPNLGFKKTLSKFTAECDQVSARIQSGELGRNDLVVIVDAFNACIEKNTEEIRKTKNTTKEVLPGNISAWLLLEEKIKSSPIENPTDALEMIEDIKKKVARGEAIPRFLEEALKNHLANSQELTDLLINALSSIK